MGDRMSEHADFVVVQYSMGAKAVVWLDLVTGEVATNHVGLREILRRGVKGWDGCVAFPGDGARFLSAVYDHFFLSGHQVFWLSLSGPLTTPKDATTIYRL